MNEENGWSTQKSKKKNNKGLPQFSNSSAEGEPSFMRNARTRGNSSMSSNNELTVVIRRDEVVKKTENIVIWMENGIQFGNLKLALLNRIAKLKAKPCGKIDTLWNCVHERLKNILGKTYLFDTSVSLKDEMHQIMSAKLPEKDLKFIDYHSMVQLANTYKCHITFSSINEQIKTINYGKHFSACAKLIHIGFDKFIPLSSTNEDEIYDLSNADDAILNDLNNRKPPSTNTRGYAKDQEKLLKKLTDQLTGMERTQGPPELPPKNSKKRVYYNIYPQERLPNDKSLKLCILHIQSAHSGLAIIINKSSEDKFNEIKLMNRKNCGYNSFQGDKVYVKINDKETSTGKVVGVAASNHKPINSLYICKVCRDQGSLMKPLDNSFPKIHVDNEPGRRRYEKELNRRGPASMGIEQKSEEMKRRELANFADNMFVSIFQIEIERREHKPIFINPRIERIDPQMCDKLFVVCYQYWDISSMYPNGTVVASLSTYDSFLDSLHLIAPICKVEFPTINDNYKKEVMSIKRQVRETTAVLHEIVPAGAMVFTIDNEETRDMDDAISYHVENGLTVIGVHITDITRYISPTHEIYQQAQRRFTTLYTQKSLKSEPIYLMEKELSTNLLSLVPNEPRAVVSVMFYFEKEGDKPHVINKVTFGTTFIISKHKLNYKQVEAWIKETEKPADVEEDLFISIKHCYDIAKQIRRARIPDSYFVRQANFDKPNFKFDDSFNAKILVEEFMILTNEHVARRIYEKYPNMSLLRVQERVTDYDNWVEGLFTNTNMNFPSALKQHCNLLKVKRISNNQKSLVVTRSFYKEFINSLKSDIERARNMLQYDNYFNDFYVYLVEWFKINHPASYECSVECSVSNGHFSLDKKLYTHFTSPVRRFSDVIVHRLLKSTFNGAAELTTLTEHDVVEICANGNRKRRMSKMFEKLCAPYAMFDDNPSVSSFILDCACSAVTNDELCFLHPSLERSNSVKSIKFSHMALDTAPVQLQINETTDHCTLHWRKIIYSYEPSNADFSPNSKFQIDNHLYDATLPDSAHGMFREIRRSYVSAEGLQNKLVELAQRFKISDYTAKITSDSNSLADPIIDITMDVFIRNTVRIQFCCRTLNGLRRIEPELSIISSTLQLCLIHHADPVLCFVPGGKLTLGNNDIILRFDSIVQYKRYFTPLIYIESLMEIMSEKSEFTLIEVPILWLFGKSKVTKKSEIFGVMKLRHTFCASKNIIFSDERDQTIDRYEYILHDGLESISGDLLCLRSKSDDKNTYWIGHGEVLNVCRVKEEEDTFKVVFFMLTHYNHDVFQKDMRHEIMRYSVDVYIRSVVSKRQMEAVNATDSNYFMKQVILGDQIPPILSDDDKDMMQNIMSELYRQRIPRPNRNQESAIQKAMTEKLSLIWGPPGTGKTSIGCILSYAYAFRNSKIGNDGVVLYCGPSNDCVNLVAIEMQRKFIDSCPKMLRIFGEQQERADFPLPGFFSRNSKPLTGEMLKISLHFLIREMDDPLAISLKNFDNQFKDIRNKAHSFGKDENVRSTTHEMIKMYKLMLKEAKVKLLEKEKYNMILCTTSVCAKRIMSYFKITQVIIDEAGMCKEPETLIPILGATETIENVVLIGDHKQLRPIIKSNIAEKRGLQISMFERYQSLRPDLVTMLNFQYRMHPSICEFPSSYFYAKRLQTKISPLWSGLGQDDMAWGMQYRDWDGIDYKCAVRHHREILRQSNYSAIENNNWPGQRSHPYSCFYGRFSSYPERVVFIHVIGDETVQSVSTAVGNEKSKANEVEVEAVGLLYEKLICKLQPPRLAPYFITVLTQYKLQEDKLFTKCKKILNAKRIRPDPIVKTVIRSQGSENDYVIFSTVRSLRNQEDINENPSPGWERQYLGFITDRNQVNVALTRAKKGLIIIGNKNLLSANKMWCDLINDLEKRGCVLDNVTDFLN